jgi:undecaprenyl phosphate-alpha-L-ara4N flippase subunit ArnE
MTIGYHGVILAAVAFEVLGQVCLKRGAVSRPGSGHVGAFWIAVSRSGWTYAGIAAYGAELLLWIAALHSAPLSQAFPILSLSYCGVAIAGRLFLNERISARNAMGIVLITIGVLCVVAAPA